MSPHDINMLVIDIFALCFSHEVEIITLALLQTLSLYLPPPPTPLCTGISVSPVVKSSGTVNCNAHEGTNLPILLCSLIAFLQKQRVAQPQVAKRMQDTQPHKVTTGGPTMSLQLLLAAGTLLCWDAAVGGFGSNK